ncbi:hypothetical protein [Streptomyces sp. NPDC001450]
MADQLSPEARVQVRAVANSTHEHAKVLTTIEAGFVYVLELVIADDVIGNDAAQYQPTFLSAEVTHRFSIQPTWELPTGFEGIAVTPLRW